MFADTIKSLMKDRKVTWKEVSEQCKIGKNQLKYWADHDSIPDGVTLIKLAEFFGVTTDYLLGNEGIKDEIISLLEENLVLTDQEKTLVRLFRQTTEEGRMRIIHSIIEETK